MKRCEKIELDSVAVEASFAVTEILFAKLR
jgi:hypothetical protein